MTPIINFLRINTVYNIDMSTKTLEQMIPDLVLTEKAVSWVTTYIKPICSTDFIGYIFDMNDILYPKICKNAPGFAVDWNGQVRIFSKDPRKPVLSRRLAKKWIMKLYKLNFLERVIIPFPEFDSRCNL